MNRGYREECLTSERDVERPKSKKPTEHPKSKTGQLAGRLSGVVEERLRLSTERKDVATIILKFDKVIVEFRIASIKIKIITR